MTIVLVETIAITLFKYMSFVFFFLQTMNTSSSIFPGTGKNLLISLGRL